MKIIYGFIILSIAYGSSCSTPNAIRLEIKPVLLRANAIEQEIPPSATKLQTHFIHGSIYFSWIDKEKKTLNILNKEDPSALFVKELDNIYWDHYMIPTPDTIIIFKGFWAETHSLMFLNMRGDTLSRYSVSIEDAENSLYSFAPPLNYSNNTLYAGTGKYIPDTLGRKEQLRLHYDSPHSAEIKLDKTQPELTAVVKGGYFPDFLNESTDYRCHYFMDRIVKGDTVVYSFECDHNLQVELPDGQTVDVKADSEFIVNFNPFPQDKERDIGYQKKYAVEEGQYKELHYDSYRDYFYRIAWHGIKYANDDGTTNEVSQKPWSIIVLDGQLNRLGEVIMDNSKYYLTLHGITKEGLVFRRKTEEGAAKFVADLIVLEFEEQE